MVKVNRFAISLIFSVSLMGPFALAKTKPKVRQKTPAEQSAELVRKIKKGYDITVDSYDPHTRTFLISINSEPDVGPNYAEPNQLRRAIDYDGDLHGFMRQKDQMTGSVYQLKKDLTLVTEKEMMIRTKSK